MSKILVTGATGHLGKAVTSFLLQKTEAENIRLLVRDAAKAEDFRSKGVEIALGDYNDHGSLVQAFKDIDKLYLVSGTDIENRSAQQENVINAAKEAGVKHVIYTSVQHKNESAESPMAFIVNSHVHTEKVLKASGLTYTMLQHNLYADIIPMFAGEKLLENKTIYLPAGDGKTAFATREDMAEAGAVVLLDKTGQFDNKTIQIGGSEAVSWGQIAAIISKITGETITYVSPSAVDFTATLTQANVPAEYIGIFSGFGQGISEGEFDVVTYELENLLGRNPVTAEVYLRGVYGK